MLTHKQLRAKALGRAEVKAEYENQSGDFALLDEFLKARAAQGLTQAQVAEKIGTTQSAVARMESGSGKHSPSLATLTRYAEALGCKLEVRLIRKSRPTGSLAGHSSGLVSRVAELTRHPDFQSLEETGHLLANPSNTKRLLSAAAQLSAGKGVERKLAK